MVVALPSDERKWPISEFQSAVGEGYDKSLYDPDPPADPPREMILLLRRH
jgi:hypothetical protein